jgi:hypothetical protein
VKITNGIVPPQKSEDKQLQVIRVSSGEIVLSLSIKTKTQTTKTQGAAGDRTDPRKVTEINQLIIQPSYKNLVMKLKNNLPI